ncbi:MAG: ATP-binding protein [Dehalococcoidia bacterium]|nr:ATP-binding protein [Dehalococcoidia bacterium]
MPEQRPRHLSLQGVDTGIRLVHDLLVREIERMKAAGVPVGEDAYRGLYVSEAEAERLAAAGPRHDGPVEFESNPALERLRALVAEDPGRLGHLCRVAGLSALEAGAVLICLASEADLGVERLIGYVQDDVTKRRPRVDLAVRLLAGENGQLAALGAFDAQAPLRRLGLITLHDEPGQPQTPLRARLIALDPRIAAFLLGSDAVDERLAEHTGHVAVPPSREPGEPALGRQVANLAGLPATSLEPPVVALSGSDMGEMTICAATLAAGASLSLITVRLGPLIGDGEALPVLRRALREAALQRSAILLNLSGLEKKVIASVRDVVRSAPLAQLVILASSEPIGWAGVSLEVPQPGFEAQRRLWAAELHDQDALGPADFDAVAGKFRLETNRIIDAASAARGLAIRRDPHHPVVLANDLYAAARSESTPILNDLAKKIVPNYRWDDIILPEDARQQLREICAQVEHRHLVYDIWGLGRRLAMGKGLVALFAGNSGTGKTMAADVIAGTLGLDLYKIDLSGIVSKYIGETEKNLASVFKEAGSSNAVLFFDEADALFGKRSEVKDAHDRYANIETAYLLQQIEAYAGVVVLATNLKMNLDEAFLRRMHFVVDFPMPDEDDRRRIWQATIPAEMPIATDVDLGFLARQFKLAGGNIRNVVLSAAFLAATDGTGVEMKHFIRGVRREYQKLGRMVTATEFGEYVEYLRT